DPQRLRPLGEAPLLELLHAVREDVAPELVVPRRVDDAGQEDAELRGVVELRLELAVEAAEIVVADDRHVARLERGGRAPVEVREQHPHEGALGALDGADLLDGVATEVALDLRRLELAD